jgi:hypothetical protein
VCFADSGHHPDGFSLAREQVEAGLDAFVAAEGEPEVVMFSGGEPSIHPQILEFCAMARDKAWRPRAQRDGSWNLPVPATLVLDRDGIVRRPARRPQLSGADERRCGPLGAHRLPLKLRPR